MPRRCQSSKGSPALYPGEREQRDHQHHEQRERERELHACHARHSARSRREVVRISPRGSSPRRAGCNVAGSRAGAPPRVAVHSRVAPSMNAVLAVVRRSGGGEVALELGARAELDHRAAQVRVGAGIVRRASGERDQSAQVERVERCGRARRGCCGLGHDQRSARLEHARGSCSASRRGLRLRIPNAIVIASTDASRSGKLEGVGAHESRRPARASEGLHRVDQHAPAHVHSHEEPSRPSQPRARPPSRCRGRARPRAPSGTSRHIARRHAPSWPSAMTRLSRVVAVGDVVEHARPTRAPRAAPGEGSAAGSRSGVSGAPASGAGSGVRSSGVTESVGREVVRPTGIEPVTFSSGG